jgi:hypothetical protein
VSKKLHSEELNIFNSSPEIIRMMKSREWTERVAHVGEGTHVYKVLVTKPARKRKFGRIGHRWECNIKVDLKRHGMGGCGLY